MTVPELATPHVADNMVGPNSDNALYGNRYSSILDVYLTKHSRLKVPFMQTGEGLHGVGSFKQSMFPHSIGLAASFDKNLAYAVGRAIGAEARSIGIHACFSPVLDLGKEPRWGRVQEAWGEDFVLTSHMGVCHFAAHGSMEVPAAATVELVADHTVPKSTLKAAARRVLSTKYDLGLFDDPCIPDIVDSAALTAAHVPLTLDAAHRSIVLLENRDNTLPIKPAEQNLKTIALVGPFSDILNFGDYSGPWGAYPTANSSTLRQAMATHLASTSPDVSLVSSWGSNTWLYNGQYNIPGHLLSADGVPGGLRATYYADTNFSQAGKERRVLHTPAPSFVCGAPSLAPGAAPYSSQSHSDRRRDTRRDTRSDTFNSLALPPSPNAHASSTITTGSRPISPPTSNARPRPSNLLPPRTSNARPRASNARPPPSSPTSNVRPPISNTYTPTSNARRPACAIRARRFERPARSLLTPTSNARPLLRPACRFECPSRTTSNNTAPPTSNALTLTSKARPPRASNPCHPLLTPRPLASNERPPFEGASTSHARQAAGNACAALMLGGGSVVGFFIGNLPLRTLLPFLHADSELQALSVLVSALLLGCHAFTAALVKERVLLGGVGTSPSLRHKLREIYTHARALPRVIRQICFIQFFAWLGWFPVLFYTTMYIADVYLQDQDANAARLSSALGGNSTAEIANGTTAYPPAVWLLAAMARASSAATNKNSTTTAARYHPRRGAAQGGGADVDADAPTRLGAWARLLSVLLALAANALLPRALRNSQIVGLVDLESVGLGLSPVDAGVGHSLAYGVGKDERWRGRVVGRIGRQMRVPDAVWVLLPTMWAASHLVFAGCMVGSFFTHSVAGATFLITCMGFSWGVTQWAPFVETILTAPASTPGRGSMPICLADTRTGIRLDEEEEGFLVSRPGEESDSEDEEERGGLGKANAVRESDDGNKSDRDIEFVRPDEDGVYPPKQAIGHRRGNSALLLGTLRRS
ncbi:hypothetical protein B0H14DRAFT_3496867 [Mycena olivaceomarginata]|nr:hypothetical protein B0H14DRAFT_3496867 [Mycena olivaceomarginata]